MSYQQQTKIIRTASRGYTRASERNGLTLADIEAFVADCKRVGITGEAKIRVESDYTVLCGISCQQETIVD